MPPFVVGAVNAVSALRVVAGDAEHQAQRVPERDEAVAGPEQLSTERPDALDLGTDDVDAEVERVRSVGARLLWPGNGFVALRDPLGLPFCVTANDPSR